MIIGICGKSGSGKSTLAKQIMELNSNSIHLDIDKIGHKVLLIPEVIDELTKAFGKSIIENNLVNRKKLGDIVFNSRLKMNKLTDITWKYMQIEIDNILKDNKEKIVILDWLLLPNTKYFKMCDIKILLDIPYNIRMNRAILRDKITEEAFNLREKASINYDETAFDYVLKENDLEFGKRLVKKI